MPENLEWISANDAIALLGIGYAGGASSICKRAHAGLIKARALRFVRDNYATDDVDVPVAFWWAEGGRALTQDWRVGDFETWIDHSIRMQAFGVTFRRSDIERARPAPVRSEKNVTAPGNNIFIGHGHSPVWRELKDLLQDRLGLTVEEFNSDSTAGIATSNRLEEMLANACFAFLIFTAEDEQPDGSFRARMNVIHEAGLFQRRLGFRRAIVLLEEGCEEFSNVHGFGHIRFPKGNIKAAFEDIRLVLEREKIQRS